MLKQKNESMLPDHSSSTSKNKNTLAPEMTAEQRHQKLLMARLRYGKPFALEVKVARAKAPSAALTEINRRQKLAETEQVREESNVTALRLPITKSNSG